MTNPTNPSAASAIFSDVAARISNSTPEVREQLVAARVTKEVNSRVSTLDEALSKLSSIRGEEKKLCKPTNACYNEHGEVVPGTQTFSKEASGNLKKCREKLAKLDKAIDGAVNDGDFGKLKEVLNKVK